MNGTGFHAFRLIALTEYPMALFNYKAIQVEFYIVASICSIEQRYLTNLIRIYGIGTRLSTRQVTFTTVSLYTRSSKARVCSERGKSWER